MWKMGFKERLFLLPTLLLIGVFSLWPVLQSLTYTFFDYRLNDQQKAGLYINERFNASLFQETETYVKMFFEEDLPNIKDQDDQLKVSQFNKKLSETGKDFKKQKGVITISKKEKLKIENLYKDANELIKSLNSKYTLVHKDDLPELIGDFQNSIIPSNFIGLSGYKKVVTDNRIGIALWNTSFFTIISIFIELVLGLGLALILNKAIFGQGLIRTTSLIPWAIPTAVAAKESTV